MRCYTSSYGVVRLVLIAPLNLIVGTPPLDIFGFKDLLLFRVHFACVLADHPRAFLQLIRTYGKHTAYMPGATLYYDFDQVIDSDIL